MANKGRGMVRQPAIKSANIQKKMTKNKIVAKLGRITGKYSDGTGKSS